MFTCRENGNYFSEAFCENVYTDRGFKTPTGHAFAGTVSQVGMAASGAYLNITNGNSGPYFKIPFYPRTKNLGGYMRGQTTDNTNGAAWGFYANYIDDSNYYQLWLSTGAPATLYLYRNVSGTATTLGSYQLTTAADTAGHDLTFQRVGDAWTVWLDGTQRINVTDTSPISTYPGKWPVGIVSYTGTGGGTIRIYDVKCWNADTKVYVNAGIGNKAGLYDKAGSVVVADTTADSYGLVSLDISSLLASLPLSGQIKVKTSGGTSIDQSQIYDMATNRTCILPGTYFSQDIDSPLRDITWIGKASLSGQTAGYSLLLNPALYYDGSTYHLYVEGRNSTTHIAKIFHWTNSTIQKTGWTYVGIAVDYTSTSSYDFNGWGDPFVAKLQYGSQANTLVMIMNKYVNTGTIHTTISIATSTDGTTWGTPTAVTTTADNGPESSNQWGGCIAEFYGKYFVYYESEIANDVDGAGTDNIRRLCATISSDLSTWASRGTVYDTYYQNDAILRKTGGISAPALLSYMGQVFLLGDYRNEGIWQPAILTNIDGIAFRHGFRISPWGLIGLNDADFTDKASMFSNSGIAVGNTFYGCCHRGTALLQNEGVALFSAKLSQSYLPDYPTVGNVKNGVTYSYGDLTGTYSPAAGGGGGRSQVGGKAEVFGG